MPDKPANSPAGPQEGTRTTAGAAAGTSRLRVPSAPRRLPDWIGDGATVSDLAYRICVEVLRQPGTEAEIALRIGEDEADVLRAFAELKRVGVAA